MMMAKKYNIVDPKAMEYWQKRAKIKDKKYIKDVKALENEIKKEYVKAKKEIQKEINSYYLSVTDSEITEYEKNRLESVVTAINKELDKLFQKEEELLTEAFIKKYIDTSKDIATELGVSFTEMPTIFVKEIILTNWSGLTFSERIWDGHRRKLASDIKQALMSGVIRGDSIRDISRIIQKKWKTSLNDASRLVRTEMNWVMNQAHINNYKDNGIKEYQFLAFIDHRTSDICKSRDGEVISVDDAKAGSNLPPLHPY